MTARAAPVLVWIVLVAGGIVFVSRLRIATDMAAFLPRAASPAQQVLVDQLRNGVVARLVLAALEGAPAERLASVSRRLASRLRGNGEFAAVENGELAGFERDRDYLWSNRYVLSDQVRAERFTADGLRVALEHDLGALGSTAGLLLKRTLAEDPTGEMLHLIQQQFAGGNAPARTGSVFMSPDGSRALLLMQLRAAGSDIDGAYSALAAIRAAFAEVVASEPQASDVRLVLTGPPVFAVQARDQIRSDVTWLSGTATLIVTSLLLLAYRSLLVLILAFVPVASGLLGGIVAVGWAFGTVQGITLGFGATLIGEAVDYAIYLFTQTTPDSPAGKTIERIWPTLRLGTLTSICGFGAMLLSGFEGFAQLGLFTIGGLATAACVTRWVLPVLLPAGFSGVRQPRFIIRLASFAGNARALRIPAGLLVAAAIVLLVFGRGEFWAGDLASLSPVPIDQQQLDRSLRRDMGAPEAGYLVVTRQQPDEDAALASAERVATALKPLIDRGGLAGFDAPNRIWPSLATQQSRQAALPPPTALRNALDTALVGLPFRPGLFDPFLTAVEQARQRGPIDRTELGGTSLSLKLDSLMLHQANGWMAMLPLRGVTAPALVVAAIAGEPGAMMIDLKAESNSVLRAYLREGTTLALLGAGAIGLLLLASLRSWSRLAMMAAPLAAAVVVTLAALRLGGHALSVFNLFALLLVVAIGSNYCLFFDRQRMEPSDTPRVLASLLLANASTVAGFAVLATSHTPVLHDLGVPVALGTLLSLLFASIVTPLSATSDPTDVARN